MGDAILRKDDVGASLAEIGNVLEKGLTPEQNSIGFLWEGTITAGTEWQIRNKLRNGLVPNRMLLLGQSPLPTLAIGPTAWDGNYVYVRNTAMASAVTATIFFYKHRGPND